MGLRSLSLTAIMVTLVLGLAAVASYAQDTRKSGSSSADYTIDIDYSATPELRSWAENQLRPVLEKWYPIIVADLPSDGFTPPDHVYIKMDPNFSGRGAETRNTHVTVNANWIKTQLSHGPVNDSVGALVHELVHVVQQYGHNGHKNTMPVWLTEGIADYIRWWTYEPSRRHLTKAYSKTGVPAMYTDSYATSAAFLAYVAKYHDKDIVIQLNAAGRDGNYTADVWKQNTGKTLDQLWDEFFAVIKRQ